MILDPLDIYLLHQTRWSSCVYLSTATLFVYLWQYVTVDSTRKLPHKKAVIIVNFLSLVYNPALQYMQRLNK